MPLTEEAIADWIEKAELKFGQFLDPGRFGTPPPNPGNGMWAADARRWANYTPEQKRQGALMNLGPYTPDPENNRIGAELQQDRMDFNHAQGRYRVSDGRGPYG